MNHHIEVQQNSSSSNQYVEVRAGQTNNSEIKIESSGEATQTAK